MNLHTDDLVTLAVGIAGGIAGFLVSTKTGIRQAAAAGFVGGFAGFTFPPIIVYYLNTHGNSISADDPLLMGISGLIGAVSWQLLTTVQTIIPSLVSNYFRRGRDDRKKDGIGVKDSKTDR